MQLVSLWVDHYVGLDYVYKVISNPNATINHCFRKTILSSVRFTMKKFICSS